MGDKMLIFAALCLLSCWMQPADTKKISFILTAPERSESIKMGMEKESVDDMYFGCNNEMEKVIEDKYFKKEDTGLFAGVWKAAKKCAERNVNNNEDKALTKNHKQAICVYTSGYKTFYSEFNSKVRTQKNTYTTTFPYHSLHFWLTSAIQILSIDNTCLTSYRRSKREFIGDVNQIIRFGVFVSTSYKTDLTHFGKKTCFKIKTCSGAYLKNYPHLNNHEQEVLIPPYEAFKITAKIKNRSVAGLNDCETVYVLESAGIESNLNCKAAREQETSGQ